MIQRASRTRWALIIAGVLNLVALNGDCSAQTSPVPTITSVVNAEGAGSVIAPNTWIAIGGTNLAANGDTRVWQASDFSNNNMPTQLDGVSVTVNGKAAFVYYISPTQVNVLTPPDAISGSVAITLTNGGVRSGSFTAPAQQTSPSFFVYKGGPYILATHADGTLLGAPGLYPGSTTPAHPGETIVLYGNGFGETSVPVVGGSIAQSGTLSPVPVITIGGTATTVQFAGLIGPGEFQFNVVVPPATPEGDNSIVASYSGRTTQSGALITIDSAIVRTSQSGNILYISSSLGNTIAQIGLDMNWGGSIVEASLNGVNYVNRHDPGREVQPALYDASPGSGSSAMGWDPVLGGDQYGHGSPVLSQALSSGLSIYTKTWPLQWYPDNKGGGPSMPIEGDMYFEQTVSALPGYPQAFQVHYKLTHFGTDMHLATAQEFPAIYVNSDVSTFVYYPGALPWTNDGVGTYALTPCQHVSCASSALPATEYWSSFVDSTGLGLTIFVPAAYPLWFPPLTFEIGGTTSEAGGPPNYSHPGAYFPNIAPNSVIEGDVFLLLGDVNGARKTIYALHNQLTVPDIMGPFGSLDVPAEGAQLSGTINVGGWALDNVAVARVAVAVDGAVAGLANYGTARPDVFAVYPFIVNSGYNYALDTRNLADGPHQISVVITDTSNNVSTLGSVNVVVSNSSH